MHKCELNESLFSFLSAFFSEDNFNLEKSALSEPIFSCLEYNCTSKSKGCILTKFKGVLFEGTAKHGSNPHSNS